MSRIYYERKPSAKEFGAPAGEGGSVVEKIAATVPSEVVAAYMACVGIVTSTGHGSTGMAVGLVLFFAAGTVAYLLIAARKDPPESPKIIFICMSVLSFLAWAYAVSGKAFLGTLYAEPWPQLAPVLTLFLSSVIPYKK